MLRKNKWIHIIGTHNKRKNVFMPEYATYLNSNETDSTSLHITGSNQKLDPTKIMIVVQYN